MAKLQAQHVVSLSERLYRLLLAAYPAEFRLAFREEMAQTFRACCRDALRHDGLWGVAGVWRLTIDDFATTVVSEHYKAFVMLLRKLFALKEKESTSMMTQFRLAVAQRTDIGRLRLTNEDALISVIPEDEQVLAGKGALFVVADGLGGHEGGEIASKMAVDTITEVYYQAGQDEVGPALQKAIKQANALLYAANEAKAEPEAMADRKHIMGTTCVAAVLLGQTVYVANVGDSRAYILRNGQMRQVSEDHSWVREQILTGLLTEEQARTHPKNNIITRCLGSEPEVEVDIFSQEVQAGDALILCTDGLSGMVRDDELREIVQELAPEESVNRLIERANEEGGKDNITAVVVRVSVGQHEKVKV